MNARKGQHQRNEFKEKGTFCNVAVFLQCLIQHSIPIRLNTIVVLQMRYNVLSSAISGIKTMLRKYSVYDH